MALARRLVPYGLILLLGLVAVSAFQDRLLYYPERLDANSAFASAVRDGLRPWPDAADYRALRFEPTVAPRATLLLFHGNAGSAGDRAWYAAALH